MSQSDELLREARDVLGDAERRIRLYPVPCKGMEISENITKIRSLIDAYLASLEELKRIQSAEMPEPVFLDRDNDGHWYLVREKKRADWEKWLQIPNGDEAGWNVPEFAKPIGGAPNSVSLYGPELLAYAQRKEAENEGLRKDAERYRWLNDRVKGGRYPSGVARFELPDIRAHEGIFKGSVAQHMDAAIDNAMDEGRGK